MKRLIATILALILTISLCPALAEYTDSETILAVQEALTDAGIYKGNLSGIKGNATEAAIRTYQQKNGLKVNGQIDDELLDSLGLLSDEVILVSKITLNEESVSLSKGGTVTLTATVEPKNARNKKVEWSSTDETVATVKDGKVTAKANGTCDIICRAKDDSGVEAVCHIAVIVMVTSVTTTQNQKVTIPYGGFVELTATAKPVDATNTTLKWSSSDESVCIVDENGKVTSVGSGDCEIECSTTDGSKKSLKFQIHVPIFDALEATYTITEKDWNLIPIDLHGASAGNITHSVSSEKFFMYYFDNEGIHIYPIAEGNAKITLTSKLNKQDKMTVYVSIEKIATYADTQEPLNVVIVLDPSEIKAGETYQMKYRISGGVPPYKIVNARSYYSNYWGNTVIPNINNLTASSATMTMKPFKGRDRGVCIITVSDAAGNIVKGVSNRLTMEGIEIHTDYDYYAIPRNEPLAINYSIRGGSGSYDINYTLDLYDKASNTTIYDFSKGSFASSNEGTLTINPPQNGTAISIRIEAKDKMNPSLIGEIMVPSIYLTDNWSMKLDYDKKMAQVGEMASVMLYMENISPDIISYCILTRAFDPLKEMIMYETGTNIDQATRNSYDTWIRKWEKDPINDNVYYYSFEVKECDMYKVYCVLKDEYYSTGLQDWYLSVTN